MQYPEGFKQKVLATLGDSEELKKRLDDGSEFIGRLLNDSGYDGVSSKEIVEACESMNVQEIYRKAKRQLAIQELYSEWFALYEEQHKEEKEDIQRL